MAELSLEARVGHLERENRRLRVGMVTVLAALVGLVCVAATHPVQKLVRAQRFEVVDAKGKARAALALPSDGRLGLWLADDKGQTRAALLLPPDGAPALAFYDDRNTRATLGLFADGRPNLSLADEKGKPRALVALSSDGPPIMVLSDDKGHVIWSAP